MRDYGRPPSTPVTNLRALALLGPTLATMMELTCHCCHWARRVRRRSGGERRMAGIDDLVEEGGRVTLRKVLGHSGTGGGDVSRSTTAS